MVPDKQKDHATYCAVINSIDGLMRELAADPLSLYSNMKNFSRVKL
jgi:hypothetical protein